MRAPLPRIGCHVSVAGGLSQAVERAVSRGCECVQVFSTSPRAWKHQSHRTDEIAGFLEGMAKNGINPVVVHAIYLLNLSSPDSRLRNRSMKHLAETFKWAALMGASTVIIHTGHCAAEEMDAGLKRASLCIRQVLAGAPPGVTLSLEMSSGGATAVGTAEHFREILHLTHGHPRLRFWLDTAHAFGAGYDFRVKSGVDRLVADFKNSVGLKRVSGLHSNDSKADCGSLLDRHENIGQGMIGLKGFRLILADPFLRTLPFMAEIPGFDQSGPDRKNLDILKRLR
jgi:deoxyribonuclease-4